MDDGTKSKKKKKKSDTSTSPTLQKILTMTNKFESQYLKPILLKLEKTESALKCLYANQKKIQNSLRKQKVSDYYAKIINLFFVIDEYFIK